VVEEPPEGCTILALAVVPMGFSWAPYFAETALESVFERLFGEEFRRTRVVDRSVPPVFSESVRFLQWLYIDDFTVATLEDPGLVSWSESKGSELQEATRGAFKKEGLPLHKEAEGPGVEASIGVTITVPPHVLRPLADKLAELMAATYSAVTRPLVDALEIRRLMGRWAWNILTFRLLYSVLNATYAFIEQNLFAGPVRLWESAKAEMICLIALAPLMGSHLQTILSQVVYQTDASLQGFGIVRALLPRSEVLEEIAGSRHPALDCHLDRHEQLLEEAQRQGWTAATTTTDPEPARRHLAEPRRGKGFADLFSFGSLASMMQGNVSWVETWGPNLDYRRDLTDRRVLAKLTARVSRGDFYMVHITIPASTWSQARHPRLRDRRHLLGRPGLTEQQRSLLRDSTRITLALLDLAFSAILVGCGLVVEVPARSFLTAFGPVKELARHPGIQTFLCDMCTYGSPWRSRTRFYTNIVGMLSLGSRCSCATNHATMRGRVDGVPATRMSAASNLEFCRAYVLAARKAAEQSLLPPGQRPGELGRPPKPAFQEAGMRWRSTEKWELVFRGEWEREDPITVQEMRTLGLLGRHLSRARGAWDQRYLVLMDSLGSIGAHEKGRSGVFAMLVHLRKLCVISLVTGIRFVLRWVPSKFNFADGPSRGGAVGVAPSTLAEKDDSERWDVLLA